jgi:LPS-assembly protein
MSQNMDATFFQRYMDKRGFKEGMEFRYAISKDSFGTFYGDYLDDQRSVSETSEGLSREMAAPLASSRPSPAGSTRK